MSALISRRTIAVLLAASSAACTAGEDGPPAAPTGTLQQSWTIEGAQSAQACEKYAASKIRIVLRDDSGSVEATQDAPCSAFEIRLDLRAQTLSGTATLLGVDGTAKSQARSIGPVVIREGETATQSVDFPADAMNP
jgi:hypothetical protein